MQMGRQYDFQEGPFCKKVFVNTCDAHQTIEAVVVWSLNFLKILLTRCQLDVIIRTSLDTMSNERSKSYDKDITKDSTWRLGMGK